MPIWHDRLSPRLSETENPRHRWCPSPESCHNLIRMVRTHSGGSQKALLTTSLFLLFFYSSVFADTIYLKNGKQIQCDSAWEEGKEVKYSVDEGTIGIPKAMVAKIVKQEPETPQEVPSLLQQQVKQNPGT